MTSNYRIIIREMMKLNKISSIWSDDEIHHEKDHHNDQVYKLWSNCLKKNEKEEDTNKKNKKGRKT